MKSDSDVTAAPRGRASLVGDGPRTGQFLIERICSQAKARGFFSSVYLPDFIALLPLAVWVFLPATSEALVSCDARFAYRITEEVALDLEIRVGAKFGRYVCQHMGRLIE